MHRGLLQPLRVALAALACVACTVPALAQPAFPAKPIRVIVPYPAGGVVDLYARAVTEQLAKRWSQPIIIDARPGASSNVGTVAVAQSEPDGYTWLMAGPGLTANPWLFKNVGWDPAKDFVGVGVAGTAPQVLVVGEKHPARSVRDLIALAKQKPGTVTAGTMNGSSSHFVLEALKQAADVDLLLVPYKGAPPIVSDVVGGTVQAASLPLAVVLPMVQVGRLRILAIAASTRSPLIPDVPTFAEEGFAEGAIVPWYGFVLPRATPERIVRQINVEISDVLKSPEVRARLQKLGGDAGHPMTPGEMDQLIKADSSQYSALVKRGNIKPE